MGKVIPKNVKVAAMKSYVADGKSLNAAAAEHGVSIESLRKWLGSKVRKRGGKRPRLVGVMPVSIAMVNRKPRTSKASVENHRSNKRWTRDEDEMLRDAVLSRMTVKETVELLGRTSVSIYCRKNHLIHSGFINGASKFMIPTGIKRVRKQMETPFESAEVEAIMEEMVEPAKFTSNIDLADLAKLVREFGVNITLNVKPEGMEVKMTN